MSPRRAMVLAVAGVMLAAAAVMLFIPKGSAPGGSIASGDVSNEQVRELVAAGARLVDVRTAPEYEGGHIQGAANVPVDQVPAESAAWDKDGPIVVYCESGSRSLNSAQYLESQGFAHVYNLARGVAAWDGELVSGADAGAAAGAADAALATGKPTFYAFMSQG